MYTNTQRIIQSIQLYSEKVKANLERMGKILELDACSQGPNGCTQVRGEEE